MKVIQNIFLLFHVITLQLLQKYTKKLNTEYIN